MICLRRLALGWMVGSTVALVWAVFEISELRDRLSAVIDRKAKPPALSHEPARVDEERAGLSATSGNLGREGPGLSQPRRPALPVVRGNGVSLGRHPVVVRDPDGREQRFTLDKAERYATELRAEIEAANGRTREGPPYSAGQATGPPDADSSMRDSTSAWCPAPANSSDQWLQLKYARPVEIREINIHEGFATGALSKITAVMPDGAERLIWEGQEPVETPPVERVVHVPPGIRSDQLRVHLDTTRTGTWQEIDAVEIIATDNSRQWAVEGKATSYWGSRSGAAR